MEDRAGDHGAAQPGFSSATSRLEPRHLDIGTRIHPKTDECRQAVPPLDSPPAPLESPGPPCLAQQKDKTCSRSHKTPTVASPQLAPCKLLTILAGNPNADITQLPTSATGNSRESGKSKCSEAADGDGVECLRAREMLMRYATSEQKLDDISRALERGCVKSGSGRGCYVKNDVIWKTLDRVSE